MKQISSYFFFVSAKMGFSEGFMNALEFFKSLKAKMKSKTAQMMNNLDFTLSEKQQIEQLSENFSQKKEIMLWLESIRRKIPTGTSLIVFFFSHVEIFLFLKPKRKLLKKKETKYLDAIIEALYLKIEKFISDSKISCDDTTDSEKTSPTKGPPTNTSKPGTFSRQFKSTTSILGTSVSSIPTFHSQLEKKKTNSTTASEKIKQSKHQENSKKMKPELAIIITNPSGETNSGTNGHSRHFPDQNKKKLRNSKSSEPRYDFESHYLEILQFSYMVGIILFLRQIIHFLKKENNFGKFASDKIQKNQKELDNYSK